MLVFRASNVFLNNSAQKNIAHKLNCCFVVSYFFFLTLSVPVDSWTGGKTIVSLSANNLKTKHFSAINMLKTVEKEN